MNLLLVEDDELLGDAIQAGLAQEHYQVTWVRDGIAADRELQSGHYDLLLLDLNLPGRAGLDVLRGARAAGNPVPVLILTARDTVADRVKGLDVGADDYLIKPFDLDELCARARALIRRSMGRATPVLKQGSLTLDPASHSVTFAGAPVEMSPREFALLRILMENAARVVSKARLQDALYGWEQDIESNAVEVHIHHLRKKLAADVIKTVRGVGYMLGKPDSA